MPAAGISFANVSYTLPTGRTLLRGINLTLTAGATTAILGRSGSGKTTLLRMVNALVMPTSGEVRVDGKSTRTSDPIDLRRSIGYVIQETGLFPHLTVERNAGLVLELANTPKAQIAPRVTELLQLVGLSPDLKDRLPWQLSGGQRQRVGLARALAASPSVILMDEPFGALDPLTRAEMQTTVRTLLRQLGTTVLLVTHDLEEALYLADKVVFLNQGEIAAELQSDHVLASRNHHVVDYVSSIRHTVQS